MKIYYARTKRRLLWRDYVELIAYALVHTAFAVLACFVVFLIMMWVVYNV